jgi:peptide/nickel transport system substrate-binding protein
MKENEAGRQNPVPSATQKSIRVQERNMTTRDRDTTISALARLAQSDKVSRRALMERAIALGLMAGPASALWSKAKAEAPKKGGHAIFGFAHGETADTLAADVLGNAHNVTFKTRMLRNCLVEVGTDGRLEPVLASEWAHGDQGATWIFTLRKGVEFHNGKTLDAQDVIESINLHRREETKSGGKALAAKIADIKADGDKVVFELKERNADFPYYLAQYFFTICPSQDGVLDYTSGVGTGPFVLERYEPGVAAVGTRNPNYFDPERPYFDSVELLSIRDTASRTNALVTGEVHGVDALDLKTAERIEATKDLGVVSVPGGSTMTMPMHANVSPFDIVDVRRAMKFAVDRVELRDKIFRGHASLGNDHPVAASDRFHNPDIPQREYDPDKARHHLKKAGLESIDVVLHTSDAAFSGAVDAAVLYAETAKKAGVTVTVQREPADGYWSNVWIKVPFCYSYWNARPTPDLMFVLAYTSDAAWGDTNWSNARFDELVVAARSELDTEKRKTLYHEAQWILHDEGSTIVPLFQNFVHGVNEKIGYGELTGSAPFDGFRAPARWWFKS